MGDTLIFTVNHRLARYLFCKHSEQQIKAGEKAWETPPIHEIKSWFKSQWLLLNSDRFLLSETQSIKIWESIIRNSPESQPQTNQQGIINQWDLLNKYSAAKRASEAYRLIKEYQIRKQNLSDYPLSEENELFIKWAEKYDEFLEQNKAIDSASLIDEVCKGMKNKQILTPESIELKGFEEITPQLQTWLDFLDSQNSRITLIPDPNDNLSSLNKDGLPDKNIKIYSFNDLKDESKKCANWVRSIFKGNQNIGIVVPELEKYRRTLHKELCSNLDPQSIFPLETRDVPFEISLGTPLFKEGMIQTALEIISVQGNLPVDKLLHVVNSPHIKSGRSNEDDRNEFETRILKEGFLTANLQKTKKLFTEESSSEIKKVIDLLVDITSNNESQPPSLWAKFFSTLLKNLGWIFDSEKSFSNHEIQCLSSWNECLDDLASLDMFTGKITRDEAIKELQQITSNKLFQVKTKEQSIQILGLLESVGMTFDYLWVMGCHSDCMPAQPNPNPFIPIDLRKKLKLPHSNAERELQFAKRALSRLAASSQNIIFSYPKWHNDNEKQVTPLLNCIPISREFPYKKSHRLRDRIKPLDPKKLELWKDKSEIPPSDYEIEEFTNNGLRAGYKVIKNQADCSFKAFAAHRLQADIFEFSATDYDPRHRGILIHKALQLFWKKHRTLSALQTLDSSNTLRIELENAINKAMQVVTNQIENQYYFKTMEQERTIRLLIDWMEQELRRNEFEVKHVEKNEVIVIKNLKLNLRIDRIDITPEGKNILIDYKTGSINSNSWFKDQIQDPQLPIYALKSSPNAIAFAIISQDKLKWSSICDPTIPNPFPPNSNVRIPNEIQVEIGWPNWNNLLSFWENKLTALADGFTQGQIQINPIKKNETCRNCGYSMLCRIAESASNENNLGNLDG